MSSTFNQEVIMSGGMCPHIFGAWCPHFTTTCSDDQRTTRCIHLPAFMIPSFESESVEDLEKIREMFNFGNEDKKSS
jgi:hypothetical protein